VCSRHAIKLEQYCFKCIEPLCTRCDLLKHIKECDDVKSIDEALRLLRQKLDHHCIRLSDMQAQVSTAHSKSRVTQTNFTSNMKGSVRVWFAEMHRLVDVAKYRAVKQFDTAVHERAKMLSHHVEALGLRCDQLGVLVSLYSKLVEGGGCAALSDALGCCECCVLDEGWNTTGSLSVDVAVSRDSVSAVVDTCWAVVTVGTAAEKVR
jgi:hypothetical protein